MIIGYARVSSTDQNLDRQLEVFKKVGVETVYADKMSGKNFEREEYQKMKQALKGGDLLYIKSIDRLGRNYDMIIDEWRDITHNIGADIVVIDMPLLDTRDKEKGLTGKFISDIVLQILSYVAETERNNIKQRQAEGIKIAKEKGIHMGRPKYVLPDNFLEIAKKWYNKEISIFETLHQSGMAYCTFLKYAQKYGYSRQPPRYDYHLTGEFVNKIYHNQQELVKDLGISQQLLKKHFNGGKTIIDRMGLKLERIMKNVEV